MSAVSQVPVMPPPEAYADNPPPRTIPAEAISNESTETLESEVVLPVIEESLVVDTRDALRGLSGDRSKVYGL
jgi:hypothetical protein